MTLHVVGVVGVPARYGGFETLVDQLLDSPAVTGRDVVVYCEQSHVARHGRTYKRAILLPLRWKANGWQSVLYDLHGMIRGAWHGDDVLVLGTSATIALPALRLAFRRARFVVNMAGLEWKRGKWGLVAKALLKANEWAAARFAHVLIADNEGLIDYVRSEYGVAPTYIPYGGDQFESVQADFGVFDEWRLPASGYDFVIARAQVDNNLEMILDAYARRRERLVAVSNWDASEFGRRIRARYACHENLHLVGPIYDAARIKAIKDRARVYVHGHSAGGTNPALVEAMWARLPVLAFDVPFNRHTTDGLARYFGDATQLSTRLDDCDSEWCRANGEEMRRIAERKFTWESVRRSYQAVLDRSEKAQ
jgi:glycosyltransferase involved in cell wall biosynthesis